MNTRAFIKSLFVAPLAAKAAVESVKEFKEEPWGEVASTSCEMSLRFTVTDLGAELFWIECSCGAKSEQFSMPKQPLNEPPCYPPWNQMEPYLTFRFHECQ